MDYQRIYDAFVADRLLRCSDKTKIPLMERHHIVPKCMNGVNDPSNLVNLTFSDHIFAHLLLAKIYGGKLAIAFWKMTTVGRYKGRHTRLAHAALMAKARYAKGAARRDKPIHPASKAGFDKSNADKKGQPPHPNLSAAVSASNVRRFLGKPAHPSVVDVFSRKGDARSSAQRERDLKGCAAMHAKTRGQPWPAARRAAQDAKIASQGIQA